MNPDSVLQRMQMRKFYLLSMMVIDVCRRKSSAAYQNTAREDAKSMSS